MPEDPVLLKKDSAVAVGVTKTKARDDGTANKESTTETTSTTTGTAQDGSPTSTTTSTSSDEYKTQFVKVYQDAGVIGAAMLTLLVLCVIMGWFSLRLLRMYVALTEQRDKMEALRLEYFNKLTEAMTEVTAAIKQVMSDLRSDHNTQDNALSNINEKLRSLTDRLEVFLFGRPPGDER